MCRWREGGRKGKRREVRLGRGKRLTERQGERSEEGHGGKYKGVPGRGKKEWEGGGGAANVILINHYQIWNAARVHACGLTSYKGLKQEK